MRIRSPYGDYVRIRGDASSGDLSVGLWSGQKSPRVEIATAIEQGALGARQNRLVIERTRTVYWPDGTKTDTKRLVYPAEPKN